MLNGRNTTMRFSSAKLPAITQDPVQTLTQQTSSPSGEMNGSRLWWSIPLVDETDPTISQPEFNLPRCYWALNYRFRPTEATGRPVERSGAWQQLTWPCGKCQMMSHFVNSCPNTKMEGRLQWLHSADDVATEW